LGLERSFFSRGFNPPWFLLSSPGVLCRQKPFFIGGGVGHPATSRIFFPKLLVLLAPGALTDLGRQEPGSTVYQPHLNASPPTNAQAI